MRLIILKEMTDLKIILEAKMQTKKMSTIEAITNTAIGFPINYLANFIILPSFFPNIAMGFVINFWLSLVYVLISVLRNYVIRRTFNWLEWKLGVEGRSHYEVLCILFNRLFGKEKI